MMTMVKEDIFFKYEYTVKGDLINKTYNIKYSNQQALEEYKGEPILNGYKTHYYYSNSKLDSAISYFVYKTNPKWNYFSKTYYNKVGLTTKKLTEIL
jgi:hypothetical protein